MKIVEVFNNAHLKIVTTPYNVCLHVKLKLTANFTIIAVLCCASMSKNIIMY